MSPEIGINGCIETFLEPIYAVVKGDKVIFDTADDSKLADELRKLRAIAIPDDSLHAQKVKFTADNLDVTTINGEVLTAGEKVEYEERDVYVNG